MMQFADSHTHLHDSRIINDVDAIMQRARQNNIRFCISCATSQQNFKTTAQLSKRFNDVVPFFGYHPWFLDDLEEDWQGDLADFLGTCLSGIGETGLDFTDKAADRDLQIKVFEHHLHLARELKRPINVHIRKAWDTFIHILKKTGSLFVPGIIHSYSGSADMIPVFEKFGFFISFSGSVTNPNSRKVVSSLKAVSKDRYVLETDTPDIYPYIPNPHPQRLNEPANIPAIAQIAAERTGTDYQVFCRRAFDNTRRAFEPVLKERS